MATHGFLSCFPYPRGRQGCENHDPETLGHNEEGYAKWSRERVDDADERDPDHPVGQQDGENLQRVEASGGVSAEAFSSESMFKP